MNLFSNLRIATRMALGFAALVAIMIALAAGSLYALAEDQEDLRAIVEVENARTQQANNLVDAARETAIHIRNLILALTLDSGTAQAQSEREEVKVARGAYAAHLAKLKDLMSLDANSDYAPLEKVAAAAARAADLQDQVIVLSEADDDAGATTLMWQKLGPAADEWIAALDDLIKAEDAQTIARFDDIAGRHDRDRLALILLVVLAVLLSVLIVIVLTAGITRPLAQGVAAANRIADGDLTVDLSAMAGRKDEIGELALALDLMIASLRKQTQAILDGVNTVSASAREISAATSQLAASAAESAAAVSETSTTVAEVRQTAEMASHKAREVSETAQKATQSSESGLRSTEDVAKGMVKIRQQMEAIADSMVRLSEQNRTIRRVVALVEDLAAQSNLLAVNAAIEAAKAAEYGRGFGVVAQEVKSLAEQSRQATNQARTILDDIEKATAAAAMATEQGSRAVATGEGQTAAAGMSIRALADGVAQAAQAAMQIAASGQQQLAGVDQVAGAMDSINQATSQNQASAKQLEEAARGLSDLGQSLKSLVGKYRV